MVQSSAMSFEKLQMSPYKNKFTSSDNQEVYKLDLVSTRDLLLLECFALKFSKNVKMFLFLFTCCFSSHLHE